MAASRAEGEETQRRASPEGRSRGGEGAPEGKSRGEEAVERRPRRRGVRAGGEEPRRRRRSRSMQRRRRCRGMQRCAWPDSRDDSWDVTFSFGCYATTLQRKYCSKHNHKQSSGVVVSIFTAWPQVAGSTPRPCAQGGFFYFTSAAQPSGPHSADHVCAD